MSEDQRSTFLSRWSRRKVAARTARDDAPTAAPAIPADEEVQASGDQSPAEPAAAQPTLPDVESLQGLGSEYRDFLRPEVDETLRRTALKKLFADPHFNVMDGLDIYIDDYSQPDPIPPAMLRALNQARGLFLFDEEEKAESAVRGSVDAGAAAPQETAVMPPAEAAGLGPLPATRATNCPDESEMSADGVPARSSDEKTG